MAAPSRRSDGVLVSTRIVIRRVVLSVGRWVISRGNEGEVRTAQGLDLPRQTQLAYFAYGLFQPAELAYGQVEPFVLRHQPAATRGSLWVRDGIPLLRRDGKRQIHGWLLHPANPEMYEVISSFEPRRLFRWREIAIDGREEPANALVGSSFEGSKEIDAESWSSRGDPVFTRGIAEVKSILEARGSTPFEFAPHEAVDWSRFFQLLSLIHI